MYKSVLEVPKEKLREMENATLAWGVVMQDAMAEDFEKVVCADGKKTFTKENLISEIDKIASFPDYMILPSKLGDIHVVYYGTNSLTKEQNEKLDKIFKDVFGVVNYI